MSNKRSEIGEIDCVERLCLWTKWDSMKQWVEPESTKAKNETFSNRSEDILTTKDIGPDKEEETEEALILTSLGVHIKSMWPLECTEAWGLLTNFLPQRPLLRTWQVPHWPSQRSPLLCEPWWLLGRLLWCGHSVCRLDRVYCQSNTSIPEGWVYHPYWVCLNSQSSLAAKYWPWDFPSPLSWNWTGQPDFDGGSGWTCLTGHSLPLTWEWARSLMRVHPFVPNSTGWFSEQCPRVCWASKVCLTVPFHPWSSSEGWGMPFSRVCHHCTEEVRQVGRNQWKTW